MTEYELLKESSILMNHKEYGKLEKLLTDNFDLINSSLADVLTELPVDKEIAQTYKDLYQLAVQVYGRHKGIFGSQTLQRTKDITALCNDVHSLF